MAQRTGLIALGLAAAGLGVYFLVRPVKDEHAEILLTAGWNEVTYTGKKQIAGVAMDSIVEYLIITYYYDAFAATWVEIIYDTMLEPGMVVNIKVSEDCIWSY